MGKMRPRQRRIPLAIAAAALLAAGAAGLAGCASSGTHSTPAPGFSETSNSGFDGAALPPGRLAPPFTLRDPIGDPVSLEGYRGKVVVVAFLYSTCGRVCVLLAEQIRGALDELPHPVPVLLVSADPSADTPTHIAAFLSKVGLAGRARYLSGSPAELRRVWHSYHVTPPEDNRAGFENTISVFLIGAGGEERVLFQLEELTPEALGHDLRRLGAS
jgi:protein SCO1/2